MISFLASFADGSPTLRLILVGLIAGGIMIFLVDYTKKKGYGADDWEVFRIILAIVVVFLLALAFAILG